MIITEKTYYRADAGKTFIRKQDNFNMGRYMCLSTNPLTKEPDTIDNYEEVEISK